MGYGQQVTYQAQDKSLTEVLTDISQQYEVYFSYPSQLLATHRTRINVSNLPLENFLTQLLKPFSLQARRSQGPYYFIQGIRQRVVLNIRDRLTGEPLAYASAMTDYSKRGNYADEQGDASILFFPGKDQHFLVRYIGYKMQEVPIPMSLGDTLQLYMEADEMAIEEVVIEYHNDAITLHEGSVFKLRPQQMKVLPGLAESDIMHSVQMLPGLESNDESAAGINVRGGGEEELLVYWDRIPIYQKAHFFGAVTSFIPSSVEEIEVYRNYIPANYSGTSAGLLNIQTYDSIPLTTQVISNSNFKHTDLLARLPINDRISLMIGGRLSYTEQFRSPTYQSHLDKLFDGVRVEDVLKQTDPDEEEEEMEINIKEGARLSYYDLNAKLIVDLSPKDFLSISAMRNENSFFLDGNLDEDIFLAERTHEERFLGVNLYYERQWNEFLQTNVSVSWADYQMENTDAGLAQNGVVNTETIISNNLENTEVKLEGIYTGLPAGELTVGYQFNDYNNGLNFLNANVFEDDVSDTLLAAQAVHGVFLKYQYAQENRLTLQPQIRVDYYPNLDETLVNPVINLQYSPYPNIWIKGAYGQYVQALRSMREGELDVSNVSESVWLMVGENDLTLLKNRQLSLGALYTSNGLLIDVDVYWKKTEGINALNGLGENVDLDFAIGQSEARGMDLMVRKKFRRYQTWLSYSLSKIENTIVALQATPFPSGYDRPHQFRWTHNVYLEPFEISLGWIYKSGTPYSEPTGIQAFLDPEDEEEEDDDDGFYEIQYSEINGKRLAAYHRLDMSLWYKFALARGKVNGMLGMSVQNLYNRKNIWKRFFYLSDVDDDDVPEIIEERRFFLGFMPNVSLKLTFN